MYKILDLKRVFSTFQETVWSHLKVPIISLGWHVSLCDNLIVDRPAVSVVDLFFGGIYATFC